VDGVEGGAGAVKSGVDWRAKQAGSRASTWSRQVERGKERGKEEKRGRLARAAAAALEDIVSIATYRFSS
jgi:hypothetical protein